MSQYDLFANKYEKWMDTPLKKFAWRDTVYKNIKDVDVQGKRVLDVACGTGQSMEILYQNGAKEVIGLDISEEQIKIAQIKFPKSKFIVGDISDWNYDELGEFDIVVAVFLFEYAVDIKNLSRMMENINKLLKIGGVFYSLTIDPMVLKEDASYYGITGQRPNEIGDKYICNLHNELGELLHPVEMNYWPLALIKKTIVNAGFNNFVEMSVSVSDEGIKKYGNDYWNDFYSNPMYKVFRVLK